ncbi:hypothetical protein PF011_g26837 [Phytophthora fragariae]|uniref:Uncharacterized protein n=1 Tax=Phytophthora fragariae TaxID=53985 RepID=A0A6A3HN75_9STRA|nr:hypothetical protein PF011_g26837 [Phytophthora fragariae]
MPFGLKNAPQIYQRMLDNALYGFTRIPRLEGDPARKQPDPEASPDLIPSEPKDDGKKSVLGRRSYIDGILITAESWDHLGKRVEGLLEVCDEWNLSISVVKSFWGKNRVEYLGHKVSSHGLEANPKDLSALTELPFRGSLRAMQSFLGSLNYYSKFIEDYAIYAAVLYELREVDFAAMSKPETRSRIQNLAAAVGDDREETGRSAEADLRWIWAQKSFSKLKEKVASTPILRHFRPELQPVVVVYANDWAISAALMQEHDDVFHPVMFARCTLKSNELNYGIVEKEVLALLRVLDLGHNLQVGREIKVLARYSTLAWLFRSSGLQGRLGQWAALLSPWTLEIVKCTKGENEILGAIAATITPRAEVDETLIAIAPRKEPRRKIQAPIPTVYPGESLWVVSFDGSARVKRGGGAYSAILWKLPEWTVVKARSEYVDGLTVNEAEYRGLLLCMDLLEGEDQQRLVICGDSNLVIRQVRGEIDCKAPGLTILRQKALDRLLAWPDHELLHVKRDWNGSADSLAGAALQRQAGVEVEEDSDFEDLVTLNRLEEILVAKEAEEHPSAKINPVATRTTGESRSRPTVLQEEVVRDLRIGRIKQAQDEEVWIAGLKKYLLGAVHDLPPEDVKSYHTVGSDYEVDLDGLLFYCPPAKRTTEERDGLMRLVVPETLQQDVLHHYDSSLEGGHQGIGRTYQRVRDHFHWRGLYRSVQRYVGECVDCETGKGRPTLQGESPGNIQATYPFQIIAMDHTPSLPKSHKGNTELLIWVDLFTGYVITKASASRTAQTIAESYEECVFRRVGVSEVIRHDREPGFMADFFRSFNKILGQRQRATMAYRPQANGTAERMVQTTTRALKMYVQELDQRDWDEYAERLTFAINTAQDRIRGETPFYLVHGWDARSTLEATLPVGRTARRDREPRRWRYQIQRYYQQARSQVSERIREAISDRATRHNKEVQPHEIEIGSQVWLYLDRVKEGYARKLVHLWHGPFRVTEKIGEHAVKIETAGTEYQLFPVVHISKLKLVRTFPDRPTARLLDERSERVDLDEALLPEDSWTRDLDEYEYEVEKIADMRTGKRTRYGRIYHKFLVHWRGYEDPTWVDEADLNCGALLHEFLRDHTSRNRFGVMESHEE